jgi:hypothetical protein
MRLNRLLLPLAVALALPGMAHADAPQRFMDRYTSELARDFKPVGVQWTDTWTHRWTHSQFGYGLVGRRHGRWFYCSNFAVVLERKHPGRAFGLARVDRWADAAGKWWLIRPDWGWYCYGDDVLRIGPDGIPLEPGES